MSCARRPVIRAAGSSPCFAGALERAALAMAIDALLLLLSFALGLALDA